MIVYEFYLKPESNQEFDALCDGFYSIGTQFKRVVDNANGSAVYAISRNTITKWVQLLIDNNTPKDTISAIEDHIREIADDKHIKYTSTSHNIAPKERHRAEVERAMVK